MNYAGTLGFVGIKKSWYKHHNINGKKNDSGG